MDKNIAAFLREGTYTVGVAFPKVRSSVDIGKPGRPRGRTESVPAGAY